MVTFDVFCKQLWGQWLMASMDHKMTFWQWGTWSFRTRAISRHSPDRVYRCGTSWSRSILAAATNQPMCCTPPASLSASCPDAEVNSNQGRLYFHGAPWPLQHRWFLSNDSEYLNGLHHGLLMPFSLCWDTVISLFVTKLYQRQHLESERIRTGFLLVLGIFNTTLFWELQQLEMALWCGHFSGRQFSGGARQVQSYTPHRAKRKSSLEASGAEKGCPWYDDCWSSWMLEEIFESLNTLTAWDCICCKPFANLNWTEWCNCKW